jgi:hypothetical protein
MSGDVFLGKNLSFVALSLMKMFEDPEDLTGRFIC